MGDYSAAGWSGGAPSGGGNIDTFNMVPVLEGLRKALPRSDVVYAVGSSLSAARHWNVVQRHEWAVAAAFAATAPSVPYAGL
ncbi:hypothetical protein JL720_17341 [Aureococcus anophagefferens]|nr:hypothetical protein JL720_17341 [Aureococcus anophagefferens]